MKKWGKFSAWIKSNNKVVAYFFCLLLVGVGCSVIYWPAGLMAVGGLVWLDLFVTDLLLVLHANDTNSSERPGNQSRR